MFKFTRETPRFAWTGLFALLALASACGPGFDPASEVKSLRVFGVQKDTPYPQPGQSVTLRLMWDDPKGLMGTSKRPVQIAWIDCQNPANDLYAGCFSPERLTLSNDNTSTHVVTVPQDLIAKHAPAPPGQPSYGLLYSFFAVCAGTLAFEEPRSGAGLPIFCKDGDKYLTSDDFVAGYTALYVFQDGEVRNSNPVIKGIELQGKQLLSSDSGAPICIGSECEPNVPAQEPNCEIDSSRCFPACPDDGGDGCPDIHIKPLIDGPAERDDVSALYYGRNFSEQMWINYYADAGKFSSDTRLLNDAQRGWNNDPGAKFRAPKTPGLVNLWVVAHDNRGGTDWARVTLKIQ
ncbi:MAG: hypothetical protein ACOY0T_26125 [Myxococcota bacterium]